MFQIGSTVFKVITNIDNNVGIVNSVKIVVKIFNFSFLISQKIYKRHANLPRYVGVTGYNLGTLQRLIEAAPPGSIDTVSIDNIVN